MARSSRWNQNPPIQPRINWGHPATKGLRACYLFNTHPGAVRNLVMPDGGAITITGSPTLSPSSYNARGGRYAQGLLFGGSDMLTIPITNKWGIPSMGTGGAFSYHVVFDASVNGAIFGAFGHFSISYDPTASWQGLSFVGNTWEGGTNVWSTGFGDAPTNPTQMFHSFPGNNATRIGWVNRTRLTNADFRSHSTSSNNNLYIGGNWTGTASLQGRIYSLMVWEGAVHENIYSNHLFENPYCVLERNPRRTYSIPSGGNTIDVPAGSLTLSAQTPTVTATANNTIEVPLATLTLSGQTPTVTASDHKTVDVPLATLTLTGNAPDVSVGANTTIDVPAGSLSLTSFNPTITATANVEISVPLSTLTVTGYNPTVTFTGHVTVDVPLSTLTLTRYSPSVSNGSAPAATEARLFKLMGGFPSGLTSEGGGLK